MTKGYSGEHQLIKDYEKKIFDLTQLIEISKSLNSNLDYHALIQSVLYICMGQLKLLKAGLFVRKEISSQDLVLHRSQVGFDLSPDEVYSIPEGHPLLDFLHDHPHSHSIDELRNNLKDTDMKMIYGLNPVMIVPLRAKNVINGVLILGDPIHQDEVSLEERSYVENIAILAGIAVHNAFLYEITTTDIMTGLRLRHFFMDTLGSQIAFSRRKNQNMSLLIMDIDNFKSVNDNFGHILGDEVIIGIGKIILRSIRQTDMACRYGGEEFIVLLPEADCDTAEEIAERIRIAVESAEFSYQNYNTSVTISLGIACFDSDRDITSQTFIDNADKALYKSKHQGKNQVSIFGG